MEYLWLSFIGGILTILSPCMLPVLPVILGGSAIDSKNRLRPIIIITSLAISLIIFALLLKGTTTFIQIDWLWELLSGGIIVIFGLLTVYPKLWETISINLGLSNSSQAWLENARKNGGFMGNVLIGFALGPIFSSCSPTYSLVIATVLPQSFLEGLLNLIAYSLGLSIMMLLIAIFGQRLVFKLKWATDPEGSFRRILGFMFIVLGLMIIFGIDKQIEAYLIENGVLGTTLIEQEILENTDL
jgi:cytochrome c-type biogenesis protein